MMGRGRKDGARPDALPGDLRVEKTRDAIIEAFITLCGTRSVEALSVADIARKARVNRTTFYRHFEDKRDILDRGMGMLLRKIFADIGASAVSLPAVPERIRARIIRFFEIARERASLFALIVSGAAGPALARKAETCIAEFIMEKRLGPIGQERLALPLSLASKAFSSMLLGMTAYYLDHPSELSPEEMADHCLSAACKGIFSMQ